MDLLDGCTLRSCGGDMLLEVFIKSIGSSFLFVKGNFFGEGFGHLCLFRV